MKASEGSKYEPMDSIAHYDIDWMERWYYPKRSCGYCSQPGDLEDEYIKIFIAKTRTTS